MKTEESARYNQRLAQRLLISLNDLTEASGFADQLLARQLFEPHVDWEDDDFLNGEYWVMKSLTTAAIISYARPFVVSRGQALPKLPDKLLRCLDADERVFHDELCELRHQSYAHSDSDGYNVTLLTSPEDAFTIPFYRELPIRDFERIELERLQSMIGKLCGAIEARIDHILQRPEDEREGVLEVVPPTA